MSALVAVPTLAPGLKGSHTSLHEAFDTLPSLFEANDAVNQDAIETIFNPLREVIERHEMSDRYGITLLHRHYDIKPHERVVEHGPVSMAWEIGDSQDLVTTVPNIQGWVKPRSWRFVDEKPIPYEFAYSVDEPEKKELSAEEQAFFKELSQKLREHKLDGLLGVRDVEEYDPNLQLEIQIGNTSVMVSRLNPHEKKRSGIDALWMPKACSSGCTHDPDVEKGCNRVSGQCCSGHKPRPGGCRP